MGHNGAHTLSIISVDGQPGTSLTFNLADSSQIASGPSARNADVRNLVITQLKTSNGTQDYFKYDPDPTSPNNRPTISFNIEDEGDPQSYDCFALMWPTGMTGQAFSLLTTGSTDDDNNPINWTVAFGQAANGKVSLQWNGSTDPLSDPDQLMQSTYGFEVFALKNDILTHAQVDLFSFKWPYCLHIGDANNPDHTVTANFDNNFQWDLICNYKLSDYAQSQGYDNFNEPNGLSMTIVDESLNEINSIQGEAIVNQLYNDIIIQTDDDIPWCWRVIFTSLDKCWGNYRRDHVNSRMLAINDTYGVTVYDKVDWFGLLNRIRIRFLKQNEMDVVDWALTDIQHGFEDYADSLDTNINVYYCPAQNCHIKIHYTNSDYFDDILIRSYKSAVDYQKKNDGNSVTMTFSWRYFNQFMNNVWQVQQHRQDYQNPNDYQRFSKL